MDNKPAREGISGSTSFEYNGPRYLSWESVQKDYRFQRAIEDLERMGFDREQAEKILIHTMNNEGVEEALKEAGRMVRREKKIVLITTTINNPVVLREYRKADPDIQFIIAGDKKTPQFQVHELCDELGNTEFLTPSFQAGMWTQLSEYIGWNTIARRNFATLRALELGADIIITIDDDNAPTSPRYFEAFKSAMTVHLRSGPVYPENNFHFYNPGQYYTPPFYVRGFPMDLRYGLIGGNRLGEYARTMSIGAATGAVLGNPDINSVSRLDGQRYDVLFKHKDSILFPSKQAWIPINTQNTAILAEFAPAMLLHPEWRRYDDIFAFWIVQRLLAEQDMGVLYGFPTVVQKRNPHNYVVDLFNEIFGMEFEDEFLDVVRNTELRGTSVIQQYEEIMIALNKYDWNNCTYLMDINMDMVYSWLTACQNAMIKGNRKIDDNSSWGTNV